MRRRFLALGLFGLLGLIGVLGAASGSSASPQPATGYVYWTNLYAGTIGRANLDGTSANQSFISGANIPFGITTRILRHLLNADGLARADVIVQAEVARKRGTGGRGTLLNACWEPWFEFGTGARIAASAFRPRPRVDAAVLIVTRRSAPLVDPASRRDYTGFVTAAFEGARPTEIACSDSGITLELPSGE